MKDRHPLSAQRKGARYLNRDPFQLPGLSAVLKWQLSRLSLRRSNASGTADRRLPQEASPTWENHRGRQPVMTWLGHVGMFLSIGGRHFLIDPVFSDRASPLSFLGPRRVMKLPANAAQCPEPDAILITHNHYDHLDAPTIRLLAERFPNAEVLVPLGVGALVRSLGATRVCEMDWGQVVHIGAVRVRFVPAHHWSARGLGDRCKTLWGGYIIETLGSSPYRFYFSGDTGYAPLFTRDLAPLGPFDFAALPIGAYAPRWFMKSQHVDPEEAVQIARDLGVRAAVGVHWGTFVLTDEPLMEPADRFLKAVSAAGLSADRFGVWPIGATRLLPARSEEHSQAADPGL